MLLVWAAAEGRRDAIVKPAPREIRSSQGPIDEVRADALGAEAPARGQALVEFSEEQDILTVPVASKNKDVTIVWVYPTVPLDP
jgi:hypothetical protein